MTGRPNPWWATAFEELRFDVERFVARRLAHASVQDVVSTVLEQLAKKSATFSSTHPAWVATSGEPSAAEVAEFKAVVWRMARMRMLDELRRVYVTKKAQTRGDPPAPGVDVAAQVDARQMLQALARYMDELPEEDRHLLMVAVDGECTAHGALSQAERVRLHRLRRQLAEKLWEDIQPSTAKGNERG